MSSKSKTTVESSARARSTGRVRSAPRAADASPLSLTQRNTAAARRNHTAAARSQQRLNAQQRKAAASARSGSPRAQSAPPARARTRSRPKQATRSSRRPSKPARKADATPPTSISKKRSGSAKAKPARRGRHASASPVRGGKAQATKKQARGSSKSKDGRRGSVKNRKRKNAKRHAESDSDSEFGDGAGLLRASGAASSSSAAAPKQTMLNKLQSAFDLQELDERIRLNIEHWTRVNSEPLTPELQAAETAARLKAHASQEHAAEEQARIEQQGDAEEEAAPAAAAASAEEASPALLTSRGRAIRKPADAGRSLAALGARVLPVVHKQTPHWNSEEYRRINREKYQGAAAVAAAEQSATASATVAAAAAYTSDQLDPLQPDRKANEIFQLPAQWRLQWQDPCHRITNKLAHMRLEPRSYELPFSLFGDEMLKFQKKDQIPKFNMVQKNVMKVTREFFNAAMGVSPRKASKAAREEEEHESVCTCTYRDPALAPAKGSREALAESAAGKSFNCGEDCLNRLLHIECTDNICGLVSKGLPADLCSNRSFARVSSFPGIEPFKTEFKGWGLRCPSSDIPPGVFLVEYVGEIISNAMCQERMAAENERIRQHNEREMAAREAIRKKEEKRRAAIEAERIKEEERRARSNPNGFFPRVRDDSSAADKSKHSAAASAASSSHRKKKQRVLYNAEVTSAEPEDESATEYMEGSGPKASNFYFLTIGEDCIIDAGLRGGYARFTNHSCAPNCHIEKWTVGKDVRIGIFSGPSLIPRGKELTIDYKYDRVGNVHRQACFCGEPNCAKFIGGKKKEIVGEAPEKKTAAARRAKEPTRLDLEQADEVCSMCGDGGDMLACDGKLCGQFCTRCFHPDCIPDGRKIAESKHKWLCPMHFCDNCGSQSVKYFCATCAESACAKCWEKSRHMQRERLEQGEIAKAAPAKAADSAAAAASSSSAAAASAASANSDDEPESTLWQTKVRRDLANYGSNVWTCCATCQTDAMCLRAEEREACYAQAADQMRQAIADRRADPAQASFGGDASPDELVSAMDAGTFSPKFIFNYWAVTQRKPGYWDDGYLSAAMQAQEQKDAESDEAFIARERAGRLAAEREEEEESKEEQPQTQSLSRAASDAAPAAAAAVAAPAPDEAVAMDLDDGSEDAAPAAKKARATRGGAAAAPLVASFVSASAAAAASAPSPLATPAAAAPSASSRKRSRDSAPTAAAVPSARSAPAAAAAASSVFSPKVSRRDRKPSVAAVAAAASSPFVAAASSVRSSSKKSRVGSPVAPIRARIPQLAPLPGSANDALSCSFSAAAAAAAAKAVLTAKDPPKRSACASSAPSTKRKLQDTTTDSDSDGMRSDSPEIDTRPQLVAKARAKAASAAAAAGAKPAARSRRHSLPKLPGVTEFVSHTAIATLSSLLGRHPRGSKAEDIMLEGVRRTVANQAEEDVSINTIRTLWSSLH